MKIPKDLKRDSLSRLQILESLLTNADQAVEQVIEIAAKIAAYHSQVLTVTHLMYGLVKLAQEAPDKVPLKFNKLTVTQCQMHLLGIFDQNTTEYTGHIQRVNNLLVSERMLLLLQRAVLDTESASYLTIGKECMWVIHLLKVIQWVDDTEFQKLRLYLGITDDLINKAADQSGLTPQALQCLRCDDVAFGVDEVLNNLFAQGQWLELAAYCRLSGFDSTSLYEFLVRKSQKLDSILQRVFEENLPDRWQRLDALCTLFTVRDDKIISRFMKRTGVD